MGGDSLYYGLNATSNNLIMVDRKKSKNPNGLILGTPGSGKSFAAKREMTNVFFTTKDDIIIGLNRQRIHSIAELRKALEGKPPVIALNVIRGNESIYLLLR